MYIIKIKLLNDLYYIYINSNSNNIFDYALTIYDYK